MFRLHPSVPVTVLLQRLQTLQLDHQNLGVQCLQKVDQKLYHPQRKEDHHHRHHRHQMEA
ncbi:hypothetical protein Goari_026511 [Gossypium aridum]|uniref:Uncharacterized protein n=1 Tax=Gossypium aridum TaxID=34290 RepID=A0A7J8XCI0_GOSAI|nr:hypothetical protein [Gossypium aridum]